MANLCQCCIIQLWDVRSKSSAGFGNNGDKVYAMDVHGNRVLVGTKDRKIIVWDVRNLDEPEQIRDSPLKVFLLLIFDFIVSKYFNLL